MLQYLWLPLWILNTDISYYFIYDFFFINRDTEDTTNSSTAYFSIKL